MNPHHGRSPRPGPSAFRRETVPPVQQGWPGPGRVWGRTDACPRVAELLCSAPATTLAVGCTPAQNKKMAFIKKRRDGDHSAGICRAAPPSPHPRVQLKSSGRRPARWWAGSWRPPRPRPREWLGAASRSTLPPCTPATCSVLSGRPRTCHLPPPPDPTLSPLPQPGEVPLSSQPG